MTTMTLTLLALPFSTLFLELIPDRKKWASLGMYDLVGFAVVSVAYVVYVFKPQV